MIKACRDARSRWSAAASTIARLPPERLLLIKPSALGDIVHALPVLHLIRKHWPTTKVTWMVTPGFAPLVAPLADEVIEFDRRGMSRWYRSRPEFKAFRQLVANLRHRRFDVALDLQGLFRSGFFTRASGAKRRIGLASSREGARVFYTEVVLQRPGSVHAVDRLLDAAHHLGLPDEPAVFDFKLTDDERQSIDQLVPAGPYAVLLPHATWPSKRWTLEGFADCARALPGRFGLTPIVCGGPEAAPFARAINAPSLAGRTTLRQLVAVLERASLVIANDSGPTHIAAVLGVPLVAVFGPTDPQHVGPYGRPESVIAADMPAAPRGGWRRYPGTFLDRLPAEAVLALAERQLKHFGKNS